MFDVWLKMCSFKYTKYEQFFQEPNNNRIKFQAKEKPEEQQWVSGGEVVR